MKGNTSLGIAYTANLKNTYGWTVDLNKEDLAKSRHKIAYEGYLNDLKVKAKVDNLLNAELFANMNLGNGV